MQLHLGLNRWYFNEEQSWLYPRSQEYPPSFLRGHKEDNTLGHFYCNGGTCNHSLWAQARYGLPVCHSEFESQTPEQPVHSQPINYTNFQKSANKNSKTPHMNSIYLYRYIGLLSLIQLILPVTVLLNFICFTNNCSLWQLVWVYLHCIMLLKWGRHYRNLIFLKWRSHSIMLFFMDS